MHFNDSFVSSCDKEVVVDPFECSYLLKFSIVSEFDC